MYLIQSVPCCQHILFGLYVILEHGLPVFVKPEHITDTVLGEQQGTKTRTKNS